MPVQTVIFVRYSELGIPQLFLCHGENVIEAACLRKQKYCILCDHCLLKSLVHCIYTEPEQLLINWAPCARVTLHFYHGLIRTRSAPLHKRVTRFEISELSEKYYQQRFIWLFVKNQIRTEARCQLGPHQQDP